MLKTFVIAALVLAIDILIYPYACDIIDSLVNATTGLNASFGITMSATSVFFYRILPFVLIFVIGYGFISKVTGRGESK